MTLQEEMANLPYDHIEHVVLDRPKIEIHFKTGHVLQATAPTEKHWKDVVHEMKKHLPAHKVRVAE